MTRTLSILGTLMLGASIVGAAAGHAQTKSSDSKCGPEAFSSDKMTYVSVPCTGGQETSSTPGSQSAKAPGGSPCGVETWSADRMSYVTTPCTAGITYENPGSTTK